jgi:uncharacterized peroxidase-related enzyme
MAFIELIPDEEATGAAADIYEVERAALGYVPNYTRIFAPRPGVYEAWRGLNRAIRANMDLRRYELATLAAARRLRSSYCSLAHGKVLLDKFVDGDTLLAIATDPGSADLDSVDRAVMALADKVARDATAVTQEDVDGLRSLGLTDSDIVDVVFAAAARCFFAKLADALGVQPDRAFLKMEGGLREALTVGRPIETL